jgi:hypothetical protein
VWNRSKVCQGELILVEFRQRPDGVFD